MGESKQITLLVALTLALGIVSVAVSTSVTGIGLSGPAVVSKYEAHLMSDGTLTEDYTYTFTVQQYRMLYRSWEAQVSLTPLSSPYIQPITINNPPGTVSYVKDHFGDVTIESLNGGSSVVRNTIDSLAEYNEVGCYSASRFAPGSYDISYTFKLFPPIEYDASYDHLNLMLASVHIPYVDVKVVIEDAGYVESVYAHPPNLKVSRSGSQIVITGSAAEDELLEVELLMKPGAHEIAGFRSQVQDVKGKTDSANFWYNLGYYAATWLGYAGKVVVVGVPFFLLFIYMRFGREEEATVPTYLSTVPNKERRPWLVNLVFRKEVFDFDEDGFYATLLDLHMRKKIWLEPREQGMKIHILDPTVNDTYEGKVMDFLQTLAKDGVFDTDTLRDLAHDIKSGKGSYARGLSVKEDLYELTQRADTKVASNYAYSGRLKVVPVFLLGAIILVAAFILMSIAPVVGYMLVAPFLFGAVTVGQGVLAVAFPATLFGKWRPGMFKEKLQWDAFRNHLGDLAQLRKYSTEDLSMWGEWLVYGTALGVGDRVAEAMRELKIDLDIARFSPAMPLYFHPIMVASPPSKSGGGGGFRGGGGGFGGGGGGVR